MIEQTLRQAFMKRFRCDRVKLPSGLRKSKRSNLSTEEVKAIQRTNLADFQLAPLILYTGMRCGEALALQWKDIDWKNNTITISKAIRHRGNAPEICPPKTENGIRQIPLLKPLKGRLRQFCGESDDFVIGGEAPLTKSALDKRWKKWCKQYGVQFDRHSIRHQYATILYESGVDAKTAQELLGHAQISTTMDIYTHLSEQQKSGVCPRTDLATLKRIPFTSTTSKKLPSKMMGVLYHSGRPNDLIMICAHCAPINSILGDLNLQ